MGTVFSWDRRISPSVQLDVMSWSLRWSVNKEPACMEKRGIAINQERWHVKFRELTPS